MCLRLRNLDKTKTICSIDHLKPSWSPRVTSVLPRGNLSARSSTIRAILGHRGVSGLSWCLRVSFGNVFFLDFGQYIYIYIYIYIS